MSRVELTRASGRMGRVRGYVNNRFPDWFDPRGIDFAGDPVGPVPESFYAHSRWRRAAGSGTRAHSRALAAIVEDERGSIFLAGDSSYTEDLMLRGAVDGIAPDEAAARRTLERIRTYASATPTMYLPSHDPEWATRLTQRQVVHAKGSNA